MGLFTLAGTLAFGSLAFWGFWVGVLAVILLLTGLTETEHWGWATTSFVAVFAALGVFGVFNLLAFVKNHPAGVIELILIYLAASILWGTFKWWRHCKKYHKLYEQAKADFLKGHGATALDTPDLRVAWTNHLKNSSRYDRYYVLHAEPLKVSDNKERIMNWMYLWPFSMVGFIFSDFVRQAIVNTWEAIYKWMIGIYTSISLSVWKGVEQDFASQEDLAKASVKTKTSASGY